MGHTRDFHASSLIRDKKYVDNKSLFFFQNIVSRCGGKIIIIDTGKIAFV